MEKLRPTFDLESIKDEFSTVEALRITRTAERTAADIGLELEDIVEIIGSMERQHFVKSMTTYHDHRIWQDVYNVPLTEITLYIKFSIDDDGHLVVSFKEK